MMPRPLEVFVFRPVSLSAALLLCLLFCLMPHPSTAQETLTTATISGRITDPSGAVMPNAEVDATQLATNQTKSTHTDSQGRFRFPYLAVGQYELSVRQPGFTEIKRRVQLTIGSAFDLSFALSVGSASTAVDVIAQAPIVEQNRSQVSQTISEHEATNLPYSGRNYLDLALLVPGVSPTNTASVQTFAETSPALGQGYSINSQRNFSNGFIVDGLSANDDAAGLVGNVYGMNVVREFQVVTSGGQAEFGRALGGYFNIITKSGSNAVHGDLYGYLRNQRLNANNALSGNKLPLTQSQYGGSLSGPIQRDRSFLYANFEQRRLNTSGIITINPANATQINTRLLAVGYKAPLLAVGSGPATLYPTTVHTTNGFIRGDHQFSERDQFNLRYSIYKLDSLNARGVGSLSAVSNGTAVQDTNHTVAVSNIAMLSPHTFNETRGQFTYDFLNAPSNDDIGPTVTISGVATLGRFSSSPTARLNYLYEGVDNLVMQHGAHTIKTGVDFLYNRDTITFPQSLRGAYTFSSLANFLSGTYNSQGFTQTFGTPAVAQGNPNVGFYVQDEWKATPRLTLNVGVRYDLQFLRTLTTDKNNISPRVGLAWSPFGNARTVVRASYGLFYDRIALRPLANALLSANNTNDVTKASLLSYVFSPADAGAPKFPATFSATPTSGALLNFTLMNPKIENPYAQQASLEVEQQLSSRSSLTVSYQHLRGVHLITSINNNINPDGTRPNSAYANSKAYDSKADSYYDGLAVSFVQKPSSWASTRLSYTWSKAIDDVGEFFFSSPVNNFFVGEDRSRSDDDQRHRLVLNAIINSPTTSSSHWEGRITHGWRLGGILQYYSKLPFNVVTGGTTKQATTQRPCTIGSGYSLTPSGVSNPCTQALPGSMIGRNAGIGFDFIAINARLSRTFAITERVKLEGIAEAFNALNHRNNMIPNGTFGTGSYASPSTNATFGQATAVGDPRSLQLAARLSF
jgi:hypothetical protein